VGLKPAAEWTKRNPVTEILLPSLFAKREGRSLQPEWPNLQGSDVALTWIGHASFLLQAAGLNILMIDPILGELGEGYQADAPSRSGVEPPSEYRFGSHYPCAL